MISPIKPEKFQQRPPISQIKVKVRFMGGAEEILTINQDLPFVELIRMLHNYGGTIKNLEFV